MTGAVLDRVAARVADASAVWADAVLPEARRPAGTLFGPIAGSPFVDGVETIYEGYLLHHGRGRALHAADPDRALLLGDHLYAAGLVEVCRAGDVEAVATLASLVSLAAEGRAQELDPHDDGRLWLAAARHLAGPRDGRFAAVCDALRAGDVGPLRLLVPDDEATRALLDRHAALLAPAPDAAR